jgi:lysozyme
MKQYVLKEGDYGQVVRDVQAALGVTADGKFGAGTGDAVRRFQAQHGLAQDGIVGAQTFKSLGVAQPLPGIDVSHWQGAIDWQRVAIDGCRFAWAKVDESFHGNRINAQHAGVPLGAYHFADVTKDPVDAATAFCNRVFKLVPGELVPMLDIEMAYNRSPVAISNWCLAWITTCIAQLGRAPVVYTNNDLRSALYAGGFVPPGGCELWLARYSGKQDDPALPCAPWTSWTLWQWSDAGQVDGINGKVDLDWMYGGESTLDRLKAKK